ncbi:MAG TPA: ubiquinol-cytochrome c reductase iron-sulfur subunit [Thermodesulfovibrionales bacterium]|nr:ubiquinol-cytochrome c reductase iron-sulfur subunit [Thermodesulfovibrionales bacterium]
MNEGSSSQTSEATTRRGFLKIVIGTLAFLNGLVVGVPFLNSLFGQGVSAKKAPWSRVTEMSSLPEGQPVEIKFEARTEDAYHIGNVLHSAWTIKHGEETVTVFSPICTHLGCRFTWDAGTGHFECPCHASVFSIDGKVLSGPAPRPLDALNYRIENGVLFVQWERFKPGTPEKVQV